MKLLLKPFTMLASALGGVLAGASARGVRRFADQAERGAEQVRAG